MGVIRNRITIKEPGRSNEPSSDEEEVVANVESSSGGEEDILELEQELGGRRQRRRRDTYPPFPLTPNSVRRRNNKAGHKLILKKGRRSRHRYENERSLFGEIDFDENDDDFQEGWDIQQEFRSHFTTLLDNQDLLEKFVNNEDAKLIRNNENIKKSEKTTFSYNEFDPERAFLNISAGLRSAMKKHLPWGMLERLEEEIIEFFMVNPNSELIVEELSSFERLLAHACSSYNYLHSRSYDDEKGKRKLKIENPASEFQPPDPSLSLYLKLRRPLKV